MNKMIDFLIDLINITRYLIVLFTLITMGCQKMNQSRLQLKEYHHILLYFLHFNPLIFHL